MSSSRKRATASSKEDDLLLQDFSSSHLSTKSAALFYGNALIVSLVPIWLYWRLHQLQLQSVWPIVIAVTAAATWILTFAYRNTKHLLKHRVAVKREGPVTRSMNALLNEDKKLSRKEKDERILWKKNEVAEFESTTFAIFYNNALFLSILIALSFYLLASLTPHFNYMLSMLVSAGIVALLSTGTQI